VVKKIKKISDLSFNLRMPSKEIPFKSDITELIKNLKDCMIHYKPAGLAAPQIGYHKRIFIAFDTIYINPEITKKEEPIEYEEKCLSCLGKVRTVPRYNKISIRYFDENWEQKTKDVSGWEAVVLQHENDHLDGILIIDYSKS